MSKTEPFITFICGFCEHPIKAPAAAEGRVGRCPNCHLPVVAPQVHAEAISFDHATQRSLRPAPRLRELFHGAAVSLVFHLILISMLAVIIIKSPELGRTLIVTLFLDTEGTEVDFSETPVESPTIELGAIEGDLSQGHDGLSEVAHAVNGRAEQLIPSGRKVARIALAAGSVDPQARFSQTAMERLENQPAAMRGDYEIALFWDGPSDLDVHVSFQAVVGGETREINYSHKGTPETGFLDVDQNAAQIVDDPIEHIRWNTSSPPPGLYRIRVHGYMLRSKTPPIPRSVPFTVELKTPDGIRSYSGSVAQKQFEDIDMLAIGVSMDDLMELNPAAGRRLAAAKKKSDSKDVNPAAGRLLAAAKKKLEMNDRRANQAAKLMLKSIERNYPTTKAAAEARELLQALK